MKKFLIALTMLIGGIAAAQTITLVSPYPPGGSSDMISRQLQQRFQTAGKEFIVTFKPGAEAMLALNDVIQNNKPNTLTFSGGGIVVQRYTEEQAVRDVIDQLKPVAFLYSHNMVVMTDNPAFKTWNDVMAESKKRPIKIGAWNRNTDGVLEATLEQSIVAKYKGTAPIMVDLKNGTLDVGLMPYPQAQDWMNTNQLRGLVSIGPNPDVLPNYGKFSKNRGVESFFIIYASAATSDETIAEIGKIVTEYLKDPKTKEWYAERNLHMNILVGNDLAKHLQNLRSDYAK